MPILAGARRSLTLARTERRRVVASRYHTQQDTAGSDTPGSSYTRLDARLLLQTPPVPCRNVSLLYRGCQMPATVSAGETEVDASNDVTVEAAIEVVPAGQLTRVQRRGADVWTLGLSERNVLTDPSPIVLPPATQVAIRNSFAWGANQVLHRSLAAGVGYLYQTSFNGNAGSQVGALGPLTGGTAGGVAHGPTALIGEPLGALQAVGWLGMSITGGTGDATADSYGAYGYVAKGLNLLNPNIPKLGLSRGSSFLTSFFQSGATRLALLPFLDWAFVDFGTNDIKYNGATTASLQAQLAQVWALVRSSGVRVIACPIMPRMASSTDGYTTAANMVPQSGFEAGGIRDQVNAFITTALANGLVDGICDTSLGRYRLPGGPWVTVAGGGVEDPNNPAKFRTDTGVACNASDGTHLVSSGGNGVNLAALVVQAVAAAIGLQNY